MIRYPTGKAKKMDSSTKKYPRNSVTTARAAATTVATITTAMATSAVT
ncbi:unnamed protein product, partial [Ascophyllum nodosum]